jgi:galactokinase
VTPDPERVARLAARAGGGPVRAWVPGRIEVLGKHTDYAGGRSLVCATEQGLFFAASPRTDDLVTITDAGDGSRFTSRLRLEGHPADHAWFTYPAAVVRRIARNFPGAAAGADVVFDSTLPQAAGMSSSSALMIGVFLALAHINALPGRESWAHALASGESLASYLATVENGRRFQAFEGDGGVGTAGGSEDHLAILCSRAGELRQYAFDPVRLERVVALPDGLVFAVASSGVEARKTGGARERYNHASRLAAEVLDVWRTRTGRQDPSLGAALRSAPGACDRLRGLLAAPALVARLDHFAQESEVIVPAAAACLAAGDLHGFGEHVARSQAAAEQWLGNQVPETSALAADAVRLGAIAASAFGAGFGGSVWALVSASEAPAFLDRWAAAYRAAHPKPAGRAVFFITRPAAGAFVVRGS